MLEKLKLMLKSNTVALVTYRLIRKTIKAFYKATQTILGYLLIAPISYVVPKKNYVVLTSRFGDFEGNLKYLYLYLNDQDSKNNQFIFLTKKDLTYKRLKESNLKAWKYPTVTTLLKLLQVKIVIVDGNEWATGLKYFFLIRAKKVQIWHGTGLKTIGLLKPNYQRLSKIHKAFRKENTPYDLVALSSDYQVETRGKAFNYKELIVNGLPRNDIFFNEQFLEKGLAFDGTSIDEYKKLKEEGYRLITYTPTWRKHQNDLYQLDLKELNQFAKEHKIKFIIKLHYKHDCNLETQGLENIIEYDKHADIYPLLAITDLLITDYSSIYLDYLLLDKPIIFYPYDSQDYIDGERALLVDYEKTTPGPKVYKQLDLQNEIFNSVVEGTDIYEKSRNNMREKFFSYADGDASKRIWEYIKDNFILSNSTKEQSKVNLNNHNKMDV
ncbi:CDP-glycerol glycerophosphotransferase family protein [Proteinivorax hydrogeniformans]|uniref:CDP-glycerol glycerophosphotransferase family protein n=1 Tax=Proteinivorax hydrogeniformans TaxID=1826727 RepID=A0AAU8HWZ6_9FIRM